MRCSSGPSSTTATSANWTSSHWLVTKQALVTRTVIGARPRFDRLVLAERKMALLSRVVPVRSTSVVATRIDRYVPVTRAWPGRPTQRRAAPHHRSLREARATPPMVTVRSCADLAVALDDVLHGRQLAQPHRAAGVQLLGADADLGPEAELLAVHEASGRVHEHGGGVDLAGEALGGAQVPGQDGFAVASAGTGDVGDGGLEVGDPADRQLHHQDLAGVVLLGRRAQGDEGARRVVAHELDALEGARGL